MDIIKNEYFRGSLSVAPVTEKMRSNRLAWCGHVMRRNENHITKRVMSRVEIALRKDRWTV
jgi:hypothetical protein